jgi:hypothetical protein
MLDNLNIQIEEVDTTYFDEYTKRYCVDAWWHDDEGINEYYANGDYENERGSVIAEISEDGEELIWKDNFNKAITDDSENDWVLEEIEDAQRKIKEEYYKGH